MFFLTIRFGPACYGRVSLPEGTDEAEALQLSQRYLRKYRAAGCLTNTVSGENIWMSPAGDIVHRDVKSPPSLKLNGREIEFRINRGFDG